MVWEAESESVTQAPVVVTFGGKENSKSALQYQPKDFADRMDEEPRPAQD